MRLLAPAKINLHLRVGPPMADGFHPLLTWMCTVGLYDTLEVSAQVASSQFSFECDDPSLPTDGRNLVVKAARSYFAAFPAASGVCARLHKEIPAGGGLGGGSSDAATMLMGLHQLQGHSARDDAL